MENKIIKILNFTEYPGPRYKKQGNSSGELFYELILKEAYEEVVKKNRNTEGVKIKLVLDLDGTAGYASSFLDECIGNLVYDYNQEEVEKVLDIISIEEPDWKGIIFNETIPQWEEKRVKGTSRRSERK